jgi:flagellar basal-body rod protein FlgB
MEIKSIALHEQALKFRAQRNEVLSSNIANADTPNYKARDLEFSAALKGARGDMLNLKTSNSLHKNSLGVTADSGRAMYRVPTQPTLDGNTVESDVEQAAFAENALQYRASLAFLDGSIRSIKFAIKGGD